MTPPMDPAEFETRIDQIKGTLYRTAAAYLGCESTAADDAVYRGLSALVKRRQPAYFETWMIRILINVCFICEITHMRRWFAKADSLVFV